MDETPDPLADDEPAAKPVRRDWRGRVRRGPKVAGGFGVGHLLLWVSCCAVYFAAVAHLGEEEPGLVGMLWVLVLALGNGAGMAGMLLFVSRWLRGVRWQVEPGEWLLLAFGARFAFELAAKIWLEDYLINHEAVADALTCCLLLLPLFGRSTPRRWRAFYAVLVAMYAIPLLAGSLGAAFDARWTFRVPPARNAPAELHVSALLRGLRSTVRQATFFVAGGAMLLLAVWDFLARQRPGWLHWVGLGAYAWYLIARELVESAS